jgi:hypothetical protein
VVRAEPRPLVPDRAALAAAGDWEEIALLGRAEMEALFGPARAERFGPLVKSWVCLSPPGG